MLRAKGVTDLPHPYTTASSQVSVLATTTPGSTAQSAATKQSSAPKKRQKSVSDNNKKQSESGRKRAKTLDTVMTVPSSSTATVELKSGWEGAPVEVWHHILSYMPTSQVARVSLISKALSEICRSWPRWRIICEKNKLGEPKRGYKSFMALVCAESYYICDQCDGRSTGIGRGVLPSELPLKIRRRGDRNRPWRLCHRCRCRHYKRYEETQVLNNIKLSEHDEARTLKDCLGLRKDDLDVIDPVRYVRDLDGRRLPLYSFFQATTLAMEIHGGDVGVKAAVNKYAKKVQQLYQERKRRDAASWKETRLNKKK